MPQADWVVEYNSADRTLMGPGQLSQREGQWVTCYATANCHVLIANANANANANAMAHCPCSVHTQALSWLSCQNKGNMTAGA